MNDLRYGLRRMARSRRFNIAAVTALALHSQFAGPAEGNRRVAGTAGRAGAGARQRMAGRPLLQDSTEAARRVEGSQRGWYAPGQEDAEKGYLLYLREQTLMAQAFDAGRRRLEGEPFPLAERVGETAPGEARFGAAGTKALAYLTGGGQGVQLMWLDREGRAQPAAPQGTYGDLNVSPDGKRVALSIGENSGALTARDVWLLEPERNVRTRFTFHPGVDTNAVWSPDGDRIVVASDDGGVELEVEKLLAVSNPVWRRRKLWRMNAAGGSPPTKLRHRRRHLYDQEVQPPVRMARAPRLVRGCFGGYTGN